MQRHTLLGKNLHLQVNIFKNNFDFHKSEVTKQGQFTFLSDGYHTLLTTQYKLL